MNNKLSETTLKKFADIFSFWIRKVEDGDEDTIEPGELCIKPLEPEGGIIYWRDPVTGKLITPNTLEDLDIILDHFDKEDGTLSADLVGGVRFYTSIFDVKLGDGATYTVDSILSYMVDKSVLISAVNQPDDYNILGWPTPSGMVNAVKISNDSLRVTFVDSETSSVYNGIYDTNRHLFIRWQIDEDFSINYAELVGDDTKVRADAFAEVKDFETWNLKTPYQLQPNVLLQLNDSDYMTIVNIDGSVLEDVIPKNSVICITYDDYRKHWLLLKQTRSITSQLLEVMGERIAISTDDNKEAIKDMQKDIFDFKLTVVNNINEFKTEINNTIIKIKNELDKTLETIQNELDKDIEDIKTDVNNKIDEHVKDIDKRFETITNDFNNSINEINKQIQNIDYIYYNNTSKLIINTIDIIVNEDNMTTFIVDDSICDLSVDLIIVNVNQTILQYGEDNDYIVDIDNNRIKLCEGRVCNIGDKVHITVIKQPVKETSI